MRVAPAAAMRSRWSTELKMALAAHVLGISIAIAASCTRADPRAEAAPATSAVPMATPDAAPKRADAKPVVPPDAAPADANIPLVDATPPPIPPRVAPDAAPLLPRRRAR